MKLAELYDDVYRRDRKYNTLDKNNRAKLKYVLAYARSVRGPVLDVGSGKGSILRHLLAKGIEVTGVEISKVCCDKHLKGLPAENVDVIAYANASPQDRYAGVICVDMLEHIPLDQLDETLAAIAKLAPSEFFGIANHSSVHAGYELHVIQEGLEWWMATLSQRYRMVEVVQPSPRDEILTDHFANDRFFFLKAEK